MPVDQGVSRYGPGFDKSVVQPAGIRANFPQLGQGGQWHFGDIPAPGNPHFPVVQQTPGGPQDIGPGKLEAEPLLADKPGFRDGYQLADMPTVDFQQGAAGTLEVSRRDGGNFLGRAVGVDDAVRVLPEIDKDSARFRGFGRLAVVRAARGDKQNFREVSAVGKVVAARVVGGYHHIQGKVLLNKGAGRLPRRAGANRRRQYQSQSSLAGAELGRNGGHESGPQAGRRRRRPGLQPVFQFLLKFAPFRRRQAAKQQVAKARPGKGRVHNRQVQDGQADGFAISHGLTAIAVHLGRFPNNAAGNVRREGKLHRHFILAQEIKGTQGYLGPIGAVGHHIKVHPVELNVGIQHSQTGRGKVYRGQLHIITVDGLLHHCLVQGGRLLPARRQMPPLRFGGHGHQQSARAAGQVGYVEGGGKLVIAPVHVRRPVMKHQAGQQRSRRHRSIVGPGELGIAQQGMKEPPRKVMTFQAMGIIHRLK